MPVTGDFKNAALNAMTAGTTPPVKPSHVSVFTSGSVVSITAQKSTSILEKTAHGLSTGDIVVASGISGGEGLVNERIYYVKAVNANELELSQTATFSQEVWTTTVTAITLTKVTEIAVTARIATAFSGTAAKGKDTDSTAHLIGVPASTVNWISYHSALSAGTLMGLNKLAAPETFAAPGKYEVEKTTLDLLGVA